jgi:uncharacterized phage protein gp47/JayE
MSDPVFDGSGLTVLRTADVRENLVDAVNGASTLFPDPQTGPDTRLGQILDCPAPQLGLVYDLVQGLWDQLDPDNAEGEALDNLCRLNGLTRQQPTYGTVTLTLTGTPATVIPAGSRARVPDGLIFALDDAATIPGGGSVDAAATATTTGSTEAASGTIDTIVDAVAGWSGVTNAVDSTPGDDQETDAELRVRREQTVAGAGSCTDQAAKRALEELDDVTAAVVLSNRTDATDGRGIYPRTRLCVVHPNTADLQGVARAVWDHLGGGLSTQGAAGAAVTMADGSQITVWWSYATPVRTYWIIDVTTTADYPADGDDLVKAAVVAYGDSLSVGDDVLPIKAIERIADPATGVPGVAHLVVKLGIAPAPATTTPIDLDITEIGTIDTGDIVVHS